MGAGESSGRGVHLVGSIPADSAEAASGRRPGGSAGDWPACLTGERKDWIVHILESFRVRRGHRLRGETLDFGHVAAY